MSSFRFTMALPAPEAQEIYQGRARYILVVSDEGLKLQLPAANFRRFVTANGIHGRFSVSIDADNKIQELTKL